MSKTDHPLRATPARRWALTPLLGLCLVGLLGLAGCGDGAADGKAKPADKTSAASASGNTRAALSVTVVQPSRADWPVAVPANGSIAAWQEAIIGAEAQGLRLVELQADVGDRVRRGQVLARLQSDTLAADLAVTRASLAEAQAALAEASANADRARQLQPSGAYSAQQSQQYLTAEASAKARVASIEARLKADEVRLSQTRILAPDDGQISARSATLGAVVAPGQELFRLIRQQRLEWRAEITPNDLPRVRPGQAASLTLADGSSLQGRVRLVGPTLDSATRNALVYVDLPAGGPARPGMYARGEIGLGRTAALSLPQTAVTLRDGFNYAYRLTEGDRVQQTKLQVGRRVGDRVEVLGGLSAEARVVESGVGFLVDGDRVKVVAAPAQQASAAAPAASAALAASR